jgi:iron complex outermembrane receptor protein
LYGLVSKGFKSGTFVPWNNVAVGIDLEPETVWNFEIGAKTDWFNQRLRANIAAFYMDYKDIQVQTIIAPVPTFENAAKATILGSELELLARPLASSLLFNSTLSYLNTQYDEFLTQDAWGTPMDASGNQFAYVPEWKVTFGGQYTFQIGKFGFVTPRGDLSWTDRVFYDVLEDEALSQDPHVILNALVKYESPGGRWRLEFYGKNLTDEETVSNKQYIMTNSAVVPTTRANADIVQILEPPRTFGLVFQWLIWP